MSFSINDWKNLDVASPEKVKDVLFSSAQKGDWQTLLHAHEAGVFKTGIPPHTPIERVLPALSILDSAALPAPAKEGIVASLQAWCQDVAQQDKDAMLFMAASHETFLPETCRALVKFGGDPYAPSRTDRSSDTCLNTIFIRRDHQQALALMGALYGDEPITHADQLPAGFVSGVGQWNEQMNLLEQSAQVSRFDMVDRIVSRIVPGSPGEEILFNLGDMVLSRLWMEPDGTDRPGKVAKMPTVGSVDVSRAAHYLSAGARLRRLDLWEKVAHKSIKTDDDDLVQFIDYIASDLTRPDFKNSAAATSRRESLPRILETLLSHGAVKLDDYIHDGKTMLMHAAVQDEPTWVAYLLEKGADPQIKTAPRKGRKSKTAAELAGAKGSHECAQIIDAFVAKNAISQVLVKSRQPRAGA